MLIAAGNGGLKTDESTITILWRVVQVVLLAKEKYEKVLAQFITFSPYVFYSKLTHFTPTRPHFYKKCMKLISFFEKKK